MADDPVEFLRNRFEYILLPDIFYASDKPLHRGLKSEASVLILLDRREDDWYVFLTQRSENLRSYAGEVAFPGGKREKNDRGYVETAIREAREETGLPFESVEIVGVCLPILSRLQVVVHPVFAYLKKQFDPEPNDEVQKCFWLPLRCFLVKQYHVEVTIGHMFKTHRFDFREDVVYGLTAHLCVLTAMLVHNQYPEFNFVRDEIKNGDQTQLLSHCVRRHFNIEFKDTLELLTYVEDSVIDIQEYLAKGKRGKL